MIIKLIFFLFQIIAAHSSPTCKNIFGTQKNDIHVLIWICRVVVHTLQNIAAKGSEIWPQAPNKYLKTHWTCMSERTKCLICLQIHIHRLRKGNKNIFFFLACGVNDVSKEKLTSREINILRTVSLKFFY